jgi:hypothetical protein
MFHLPAAIVRLLGNDALGFNLWIAVPFPAALDVAVLSRRFQQSPRAWARSALRSADGMTSNFRTCRRWPPFLDALGGRSVSASPSARGVALLAIDRATERVR